VTKNWIAKLFTLEIICSLSLITIGLICLVIVLNKIIKDKLSKQTIVIAAYIFLVVIQLVFADCVELFVGYNKRGKLFPVNQSVAIYLPIEFGLLGYLLSSAIKAISVKKYLLIASIFFLILTIYEWFTLNQWSTFLTIVSTTESLLLIIPSLIYFIELMKSPPTLNLIKEPNFWIVTGILFLFVCITPLYLFFKFTARNPEIQIIDYLAYATTILLFTKASLCKPYQTI